MLFDSIDEILDWPTYKKRLKADLQKVKSGKVKFTYYEKFKFGDNKVRPLLLVGKPKNKGVMKEVEEKKPQKMSKGVCFRANEESGEVIRFLATKGTPDEADVQKAVMWSGLSDKVKVGQGTEADEAEADEAESEEAGDTSSIPPPLPGASKPTAGAETSSIPTPPPPPGSSTKTVDIPTPPPPPEASNKVKAGTPPVPPPLPIASDQPEANIPTPPPLPGASAGASAKADGDIPKAPPLPPVGGAAKSNKVQGPATAESAAFTAKLAAVMGDVKRAAERPDGLTIKLKASEAAVFARKNDFARANALLDEAIALLKTPSPEQEWESRWGDLEPKYLKVVSANPPTASKMRVVMVFATEQAGAGNFSKALAALKQLEALVTSAAPKDDEASDPTAASAGEDESAEDEADQGTSNGDALGKAMAGWVRARAGVVASLDELSAAINGMEHSRAAEAVVMLRAIRANLTPKPDTLKSVNSLERYIETDSIIDEAEAANGFGIDIDIKDPLLEALAKLKPLVPA